MILVKPSFEVLEIMGCVGAYTPDYYPLQIIEKAGRTCYKTENRITTYSAEKFVKMIMDRGHESVLEHSAITVKIICDRGVTHEIVRHRLVAYSQESTRYCNYKGGVTFVIPPWVLLRVGEYQSLGSKPTTWRTKDWVWFLAMERAETSYIALLKDFDSWEGWSPQQARSVLPNSLKTEIVMTCNIREWRHILKLRTSPAAHPQMQEVMIPILKEFQKRIPIVFDDIKKKRKK